MTQNYRVIRKIDPNRGMRLGDGSPNDADRVEIGPAQLAFGEWQAAGLTLPNLERMREYRWRRLTQHIVDPGYGGPNGGGLRSGHRQPEPRKHAEMIRTKSRKVLCCTLPASHQNMVDGRT